MNQDLSQASTFAESFASNVDTQLSRWLGAIPILILQRLNVVSIINRYCPCQADVDEGTVALILALNRLMSPRPLVEARCNVPLLDG